MLLLTILILNLVVSLTLFDPKLATGGDNAQYMILARALTQGEYANLHEPGTPPHTQYPPVFPLLLAPLVAAFGLNPIPLKLLVLLLSLASLAMFSAVLGLWLGPNRRLAPLVLLGFSPLFFNYSHYVFSEMPFIFFSLVSLYFLLRSDEHCGRYQAGGARHRVLVALAGFFAAVSFLTRTQGAALPAAIVLLLAYRRRWQEVLVFVGTFVLVCLPWFIRDFSLPHTGGYLEQLLHRDEYNPAAGNVNFRDMLSRLGQNLAIYAFRVYPKVLVPIISERSFLAGFLGLGLWATTLVGLAWRWRHGKLGAPESYCLLAVVLLLVWPSVWSGDRFLLPVLPFLLGYLVLGLERLGEWLKARRLVVVVTTLLLVGYAVSVAQSAARNLSNIRVYLAGDTWAGYDDTWRTYFQAVKWVKDNTAPHSVVVSRKPQFTYLLSNRQSFTYPYVADDSVVLASLKTKGATHAFLETFFGQSMRFLYPVIKRHPERFELLTSKGRGELQVQIYRVVPW
ncbi:MAG: hypothetical protein ABIK62_01050 [candidate division WOR-3 bacterium]